jgi:tetratricopeptide (TPR) repeat protein
MIICWKSIIISEGEWEKSLALIEGQAQEVSHTSDKGIKMRYEIIRANSLLEIGKPQDAKQILQQIIYTPNGEIIEEYISVALLLTRAHLLMNEVVSAEQLYKLVEAKDTHSDSNIHKAYILYIKAQIATANKDYETALNIYSQLLDLLDQYRLRWIQGLAYLSWSDTLIDRGQPDDLLHARSKIAHAIQLFEEIKAPGYEAMAKNKLDKLDSA